MNITHIQIGINKALYNREIIKKFKFESLKNEILYNLCDRNKIDLCADLHKIEENSRNYFVLFINIQKKEVKFYNKKNKFI